VLNLFTNRKFRDCEGTTRREFIKIGSLGMGAMSLPDLLAARAQAAAAGRDVKDTSVVWVWLGGGPTHIETFDPKMSAPSEYRSVTGEVTTNVSGITLGGTFPIWPKWPTRWPSSARSPTPTAGTAAARTTS